MKTLGIKFQVAGVKEAQAGLDSLRHKLNASLRANKQAVKESFGVWNTTRAVSSSTSDRVSTVRLDQRSVNQIANLIQSDEPNRVGLPPTDPITQIRRRGLIRGTIASTGNNIRSIYKGFLESIGGGLGTDFGEGLKKALEEDLDFSFKRRGEVTGKTAAFTISEGGRELRKEFGLLLSLIRKTKVKDTTPSQAASDANEVRKSLTRLFSLLPTKFATGYRRAAVQLEGLPRVDKLKNRDENKARQFKDTTESVIYSFGGFAGRKGKAGFENAEMLREVADDLTEIVGMDTQFTDLTVNAKKTTQWVIEALGTVAGINLKGFNPDAIKGSAKILNDLDANPNVKAKILGHSAGGFPSEEIVQILNLLGYGDRVSGISTGTPNMKGRLDAPNFDRVMGEGDKIMRGFEKGIDPVGLFADDAEILEGVHGHGFQDYLQNERYLELVFGKRIKTLVERYRDYLKDLAGEAKKSAPTKISEIIPNYQNLNLDQKKSTAGEFNKNLKVISKRYRQAVKDNDLNLARELGENLLQQIQYLRALYKDILDEGGSNRSISGNLGNLTKIETEIISGQPNLEAQGYDGVGLAGRFKEQLTAKGENVVDGFVDGIRAELKRVKEAGSDLGESLQDGTDENLGIASPAKRYIKKGKQVVQGFVKGIKDKLGDAVDAGKNLGDATVKGTVESGISKGVNAIKSDLVKFFDAIGDRFPVLKRFRRILLGLAGLMAAKMGLDFVVNILKKVGRESLQAAMAMESLNLSILFASRDALKGGAALEFISQSAKQLSVDLLNAKNQYSKLLAAARNTSLEGTQINRVFTAFAETAANRGLGVAQQQQVFKALEQIINKRFLGREEVVQQLGDVFSGFEGLLSETLGVSSSQLGKMMENKELGLDVLPKIAAALEAQNAAVGSIDTAQKAQTRFNNALTESKVALGEMLQPLQKFVLNLGTKAVEDLRGKLGLLFELILTTGTVSLFLMFGQFNLLKISTLDWAKAVNVLTASLRKLWAAKFDILKTGFQLVALYGLVVAAYKTWMSVIDLSKNKYQEQADGVERLSRSIDRYREAVAKANGVEFKGTDYNPRLMQEGYRVPENKFGNMLRFFTGGEDYVNLDSLVRNRWNGMFDRLDAYNQVVSGGTAPKLKGRLLTESERRQADFVAETGDLNFKTDQLLTESQAAFDAADKIVELNAQIALVANERETLLAGDKEGRQESLEAERKLIDERDEQQKILTSYQQSIASAIAENQKATEALEVGRLRDGFDPKVYEREKNNLTSRQEEAQKKLDRINDILGELSKTLTVFEKKLKISSIRLTDFVTRRQLKGKQERTQIIDDGIELQLGDAKIELEINASQQRELTDIIAETEKVLEKNIARLQSGALNTGYLQAKNLAKSQGYTLSEQGIEDLLSKNLSKDVKDALLTKQKILADQKQLADYREQLAQNLKANRSSLIDYNRTINDYFFRITQQIKEAQIEVLRIVNQIIQTNIRNKLQAALSPNANSFVNQLISSTQSLLDQAASYADKLLGQRSARIQLKGQQRSLQTELQDFARNVGGASDALLLFEQRLRGDRSASSTNNDKGGTNNNTNINTDTSVSSLTAEGSKVAKNALSWKGKHFKKGVYAMCAGFVRQVLKDAGIDVGVTKNPLDAGKQPNNGPLMARSFFGSDIGTVFKDKSKAKPGDIIGFFDTYQYGQKPGAITHVGIYQGNDMMVDRSTSSAPVRHRSINTFGRGNYVFVRPKQYENSLPILKSNDKLPSPPNVPSRAKYLTDRLIDKQNQRLDLQDSLIQNQEKEALDTAIANNLKSDRQKIDFNITDSQFARDKLIDAGKDLMIQYDFKTAESEAAKMVRTVNNAFSDRGLQLLREIVKYTDEINAINDAMNAAAPKNIARLRASGRNDEADILVEKAAQAQLLLKPYQDILQSLTAEYENVVEAAEGALKYVNAQNELKVEQERLNKRSLLLTQQATIAEARGTLSARRKVKLHQEDLRLALKINELRQQYAPGEYLDSLITGERRQSQVSTENINYDSELQELDLEQKLLNYQNQIDQKKAGFLSRYGFNLQGDKLKRENAIAQENLRFERELVELRKQYQDRPEELEELTRRATELNRVNLVQIENEFKSLGKTVEDFFISSTQGFFSNFVSSGFDFTAQREQQELEERLRYAEELNQLENQYRNEPGKLAHLKNRARELNEEKLDKIRNEFNLFSRTVDLAKQAVMEFIKQLAAMVARQAAAKFISSIFGGAIGGIGGGGVLKDTASHIAAVGNDFGAGVGMAAFTADKGATVGDRKISDRNTSILRRTFPGIAGAWRSEGSDAQLGVFHTGEELLSRKTGEAGRYQQLKRSLGFNPLAKLFQGASTASLKEQVANYAGTEGKLANRYLLPATLKVPNYSEGGTVGRFDVGSNILSGFGTTRPRIDLSVLNNGRRSTAASNNKTINLSQTIYAQDADSFRLNEDQRNQDLMERLRRGI